MQFTDQHVGGMVDDMKNVGPAFDMQSCLDNVSCDHDQQQRLQQQQQLATAKAIYMQQSVVGGDEMADGRKKPMTSAMNSNKLRGRCHQSRQT